MFAVWPTTMQELRGANQFGDWLLALIVGLNFTAAASLGRFGDVLVRWARPIKAAAGCTFSPSLPHAVAGGCISNIRPSHMGGFFVAVAIGIAVLAQIYRTATSSGSPDPSLERKPQPRLAPEPGGRTAFVADSFPVDRSGVSPRRPPGLAREDGVPVW